MKLSHILPLAALSSAIVIPTEEAVLNELTLDDPHHHHDEGKSFLDTIKESAEDIVKSSKELFEDTLDRAFHAAHSGHDELFANRFDAESWLAGSISHFLDGHPDHPDRPPHRKPSPFGRHGEHDEHVEPPEGKPPHKKPDGKPPKPPFHDRPPHHGHGPKPTASIYELISKSNYTTKLAKLIDEDGDLVSILNGTAANYTLFAPTDEALEKIPKEGPFKPSKEYLKALLYYHIAPDFYPSGRVLGSYTIPTLYNSSELGPDGRPQRLAPKLGFRGLTLNGYAKVIATDIFATNGVIHALDFPVLPPPDVLSILRILPGEFSTLSLGLSQTGLAETLNHTAHKGSTFFAPTNHAFRKLGFRVNAFLFSKAGEKYLKALLEYHVVHNRTLYSDAFYNGTDSSASLAIQEDESQFKILENRGPRRHHKGKGKGKFGKKDHKGEKRPKHREQEERVEEHEWDHQEERWMEREMKHHREHEEERPEERGEEHHREHRDREDGKDFRVKDKKNFRPKHHDEEDFEENKHHMDRKEKPRGPFRPASEEDSDIPPHKPMGKGKGKGKGPRRHPHPPPPYVHVDLPTLLEGHDLAVDIVRHGPFIRISVNHLSHVVVSDGPALDGVIQVVSDVLIPPKKLVPGQGDEENEEEKEVASSPFWDGRPMSVREFKERFQAAGLVDAEGDEAEEIFVDVEEELMEEEEEVERGDL